jgi:hypothetical protein
VNQLNEQHRSTIMQEDQSKGGELIQHEGTRARKSLPVSRKESTPMALISMAVQQGADIEYLKQLMDLQERFEANEAKKAYNAAFASFKAEAITILRQKEVTSGPLEGRFYAELYSIIDAVAPAMSKHGLSHSWKLSKDEKDWIEITCTVKHELGHSESVSMGGPPDTGGAKNPIHARASTVTYLEKYTLKAICGVSERNDDTDGRPPKDQDVPLISAEQLADLVVKMAAKGITTEQFCKKMRVATVAELESVRFQLALNMINNTKGQQS